MKNLESFGVQSLDTPNLEQINGGYWKYTWSGTDNELVYAAEAAANGIKLALNAGEWIYNQF